MIINQKDKMRTRKETIKDNERGDHDKDRNMTRTTWQRQKCDKDKNVLLEQRCANLTRTKTRDGGDLGAWSISSAERILILRFSLMGRQYNKLKFVDCRLLAKINDCWLTTHRIKAKRVVVKWTLPSESSGMFILGKDDDDDDDDKRREWLFVLTFLSQYN